MLEEYLKKLEKSHIINDDDLFIDIKNVDFMRVGIPSRGGKFLHTL